MLTARRSFLVCTAAALLASVTVLGTAPSQAGGGGLDAVDVDLTPVATVNTPMAMTTRAGTDDLYVAERAGVVRRLDVDGTTVTLDPTPVLDFDHLVTTDGERGFLGLAFNPAGRRLFVSFTNPNGHLRVDEYRMSEGGFGTTAIPETRRAVITVRRNPNLSNHNGGDLAFGPDTHLYLAVGDGGGGGDPDGNGQNRSTLLGSIIRIRPYPSGTQRYTVPAGNPYKNSPVFADEIWLYGVRNPWRFSFDTETGDLWIGDVGQGQREEVDVLRANANGRAAGRGRNLGWSRMEGTIPFNGGTPPPNHTGPKHEYDHSHGCSITGGYLYRGGAIPGLDGAYLFGDFCTGNIEALRVQGGAVTDHADLGIPVSDFTLYSFGQGADGELYVLQGSGPISRIDPAAP